MKSFAVLQLSGCAGCEVAPLNAGEWTERFTLLTFPLSRIEGHAQVVIEVHGGEVLSAYFQATELRGFEYLVQGTPAEQMPVIVPRICGVCSTAHHVAAVKALEDAYGVTPPRLAFTIRELLLGQLIQNQATSLFVFTMPDRLGLSSILQAATDSVFEETRARVARWALKVRKAGTDLITLAGGQFIHPIKAVVGRVTSGIGSEAAGEMRTQLDDALPIASEFFLLHRDIARAAGAHRHLGGRCASLLSRRDRRSPAQLSRRRHPRDGAGRRRGMHLFCS